jgi:hypothetical protein
MELDDGRMVIELDCLIELELDDGFVELLVIFDESKFGMQMHRSKSHT